MKILYSKEGVKCGYCEQIVSTYVLVGKEGVEARLCPECFPICVEKCDASRNDVDNQILELE